MILCNRRPEEKLTSSMVRAPETSTRPAIRHVAAEARAVRVRIVA